MGCRVFLPEGEGLGKPHGPETCVHSCCQAPFSTCIGHPGMKRIIFPPKTQEGPTLRQWWMRALSGVATSGFLTRLCGVPPSSAGPSLPRAISPWVPGPPTGLLTSTSHGVCFSPARGTQGPRVPTGLRMTWHWHYGLARYSLWEAGRLALCKCPPLPRHGEDQRGHFHAGSAYTWQGGPWTYLLVLLLVPTPF